MINLIAACIRYSAIAVRQLLLLAFDVYTLSATRVSMINLAQQLYYTDIRISSCYDQIPQRHIIAEVCE